MYEDLLEELIAAGGEIPEVTKVAYLLMTLSASFDGVITAIETLCPDDITLAFVKICLLDHETKISQDQNDTSAKVLHVGNKNQSNEHFYKRKPNFNKVQKKGQFKKHKQKKELKCFHCGRTNHLIKDCFYHKRSLKNDENEKAHMPVKTVQSVQPATQTDSNIEG